MDYTLIRSRRRTIALEVTTDGRVLLRAPLHCPQDQLDTFWEQHRLWAEQALLRQAQRRLRHPEPNEEQRAALQALARQTLPPLVNRYAEAMRLFPTGLTITGARTRFGSCSATNRLCFSWRLMQYPTPAIEYVVVHELAHIAHKNHSAAFYQTIEETLPDYRARRQLLRQ